MCVVYEMNSTDTTEFFCTLSSACGNWLLGMSYASWKPEDITKGKAMSDSCIYIYVYIYIHCFGKYVFTHC